jgi:predicted DNA-binding transcriptional regulator AlpA
LQSVAFTERDRLIGIDEVQNKVQLSRSTLWRLRRTGGFPDPIAVSPHRKLWLERAVDAWISAKVAGEAVE